MVLAILAGSLLGFLIQTGLLWPFLVILFVVGIGMYSFWVIQPSPLPIVVSEEPVIVLPPPHKQGLLAQIRTLDDIQQLTGKQFEVLVAEVMTMQGYRDVQVVGRSRDLGVDITAVGLHGERVAVQCKRYQARKKIVSRDMQAFYGMVQHHGAQRGLYVTTSSYTRDARQLADEHAIELVDGERLMTMLATLGC